MECDLMMVMMLSGSYVNPEAPNASSNRAIWRSNYGGLAILKQWLTYLPGGQDTVHWSGSNWPRGCSWQCWELWSVSSGVSTGGHCDSNKCWPQKWYDWKLRATLSVCNGPRLKFYAGSQRSERCNERWANEKFSRACFWQDLGLFLFLSCF